ncbi:hypothetical protein SAMN04488571_1204 [Methanoculleus thermophilus]|uniref:Uncharacterized protein n=1 Tax=Methanoculleus thermophilus TaxID=2200 RepID=A0A1G9CJF7_9EURY|nr:hypothetical protein SAMN04488571_1204 [Methanoculleus thermophilus]
MVLSKIIILSVPFEALASILIPITLQSISASFPGDMQ